jgi:hypothetical protein
MAMVVVLSVIRRSADEENRIGASWHGRHA